MSRQRANAFTKMLLSAGYTKCNLVKIQCNSDHPYWIVFRDIDLYASEVIANKNAQWFKCAPKISYFMHLYAFCHFGCTDSGCAGEMHNFVIKVFPLILNTLNLNFYLI